MGIQIINAMSAASLQKAGAVLVDIREAPEFAREHIVGARHVALSQLCEGALLQQNGEVIFYCKAGNRTRMNAELLQQAAGADVKVLEGGIESWKAAGLSVRVNKKQPIEMMRQVQIAAGALALIGAVLGYAVSEGFYALSGAVGAGLLFSGVSGSCAMAGLLRIMPWNRVASQ